jgi:hypothetical protein
MYFFLSVILTFLYLSQKLFFFNHGEAITRKYERNTVFLPGFLLNFIISNLKEKHILFDAIKCDGKLYYVNSKVSK